MRQIGELTEWGEITAVGITGGERYYWLIDRDGTISMMPASTIESKEVMPMTLTLSDPNHVQLPGVASGLTNTLKKEQKPND